MSAALPPVTAASLGASSALHGSLRVRFRRALVLMVMTVVAPGSAQLVAGDKRVGRAAMRLFAAALVFVVVLAALALWRPSALVTLATQDWFLSTLRLALVGYAVCWACLVMDAWRISEPLGLVRRHRLVLTAINGALCFSLSGGLLYASHLVAVQNDFISTVFGADEVTEAEGGRYNVLLLGGDSGPDRSGLRPDSITLASIDEETGRTVLFGLPRNLANVPFPDDSPMHEAFPNGFTCDGCYLNAVNTWANDHPELFPGVDDPGIEATSQTVEEITGLTVNYYVLVDLGGFRRLVDAVGGVTVKVHERIPMAGPAELDTAEWIEPGEQHLDGNETLWFARSRVTSNDYSRMARQKCVMSAMLDQLDPQTVLTRFGRIASAGKEVLATSVPRSELPTFVDLALKSRRLPLASVSFVPPMVNTSDPDWSRIRGMVEDAIELSEAKDDGTSTDRAAKKPKNKRDANHSANLTGAC